jgi:2-polyprenyl-6-methoxyphenol hydroxylase-like FAD-dependent oxidoreductase
MSTVETTCCVVGGGPAGVMMGFLLARAGISVTVLEKHADFLRDFRGDTIHPSTARLMDQLGLGAEFRKLPMRTVDGIGLSTETGTYQIADFRRLPGPYRLGFLPQWDFLEFLADQGRRYPSFDLRMGVEATDLIRSDGRVVGVRVTDTGRQITEVRTELVVAADGRQSRLREASRLEVIDYGAPMDVLWFRIERRPDDPEAAFGRLVPGHLIVMIDRSDYWQAGYVIAKGGADAIRAAGIEAFRQDVAEIAPFLADRVGQLASFDDISLLTVQVNRLRRWWAPGLLFIGDAAHAMSPVAGVGINLAIQDAVAAARILAPSLRSGPPPALALARVQLRRTLPTRLTQLGQRMIQDRVIRSVIAGSGGGEAPWPLRLLTRVPALQVVPAWLVGRGVMPERPPADAVSERAHRGGSSGRAQ